MFIGNVVIRFKCRVKAENATNTQQLEMLIGELIDILKEAEIRV